jgi:hypothetical protein
VSLNGDTASGPDKLTGISPAPVTQKNPGTMEHHHLASPSTSLRHHDLVVAIISHFVALACGLTSKGTRHRRGLGQQPCSHARGIHLHHPSTLRGSHRPDTAARAHQAPSGPAEPKWARKAPATLLQYAGRRAAVLEPLPVVASTTRMLGRRRAQPARAHLGPPNPSEPGRPDQGPTLAELLQPSLAVG